MPYFGNDKTMENILRAIDFYVRFEHIRNPFGFIEDTFKDIMMFRESIFVPDKYNSKTWEIMIDLGLVSRSDSQTYLDMGRIREYYEIRGQHFFTDGEVESIGHHGTDDECFEWEVPPEEKALNEVVLTIVKAGGRKGVRQEALISEAAEMGWGRDEVLKALESLRCKACIYENPEGVWKSVA